MVATILSAQSTDKGVNLVTPALFRRYPDVAALAKAEPEELEEAIHSTGFFRMKAKNLMAMAQRVISEYGGEIPATMEHLVTLPGVARKTANVVLGTAFGVASGIAVDTHVQRVVTRLGLSSQADRNKIERDLMAIIPEERWIAFSHEIIWHGRRVCHARKPKCETCSLAPHCPSAEV